MFLLGFLISSALGTFFAQIEQWQVFDAIFLVLSFEITHNSVYKRFKKWKVFFKHSYSVKNWNYFKIGLLFGFFVDAFKLGS